MTPTERFEAIGSLYYGATGYLRPGKSEPLATNRDSSDPENVARFDQWFATRAFNDAIARIVLLEQKVEKLEAELELLSTAEADRG